MSRNARLKFIQSLVLHRAYLTPHKIHRMFTEAQHQCPRCKADEANFLHMLWSCPHLLDYWNHIRRCISEVTHITITENALECLVGLRKRSKALKVRLRFLDLALILAIRNITMRWKSPRSPTVLSWQHEVTQWGKAESIPLKREEDRGLRKQPISMEWNIMLLEFENVDTTPSQSTSDL